MGFWKKLFSRKKEIPQDDPMPYDRKRVNFDNKEERTRFLTLCLEQIGEAGKELEILEDEYSRVTAFLTDMEEIEALPDSQRREVKTAALKIISLSSDLEKYGSREPSISEEEFRQIAAREGEIEEGISKIKENEKYRKLVKQDMSRLDGERHAFKYRKNELENMMANAKGTSMIVLVALVICIVMLLVMQFGFDMKVAVGYFIAVVAAAVTITVLFVKYTDAEKELAKVEASERKLIQLQNTVKIRYVNNSNLLDFLYLKYQVESGAKLEKMWNAYVKEKELRKLHSEAQQQVEQNRRTLYTLLQKYRVRYPDRWVTNPETIVNPKEMLEVRHALIMQRQVLRKQMDYNNGLMDSAKSEIKAVVAEHPQYKDEINEMVDAFSQKFD